MSISASPLSNASRSSSPPFEAPAVEGDNLEIVGDSAAMKRLRLQVRRIAPHFRTVLLSGNEGAEKELIARTLHRLSPGASGPFVACHAAAFEDTISKSPASAMGTTGQGTLFLDRANELSPRAQAKLLHCLRPCESSQKREEALRGTDLRIIASTSEDMKILASAGRFRQDLYQRLAMVEITVPSLRERPEDIPVLVKYFLDQIKPRIVLSITEAAMERMRQYEWPGDVRELETVLRNSVSQSQCGVIESHHLTGLDGDREAKFPQTTAGGSVRLQDIVEQHVLRILKDCGGNKLRAAELLGISRSTLYRMLNTSAATHHPR